MPGLQCWKCRKPASIHIFKTEDVDYQQGVPYGKLFCFKCYETHNHDDFHDLPSDQDDPPDAPPEMHHEIADDSDEEVDDSASIGSSWQVADDSASIASICSSWQSADDAISLRSWLIQDDCSSTKSFNLSYKQ